MYVRVTRDKAGIRGGVKAGNAADKKDTKGGLGMAVWSRFLEGCALLRRAALVSGNSTGGANSSGQRQPAGAECVINHNATRAGN